MPDKRTITVLSCLVVGATVVSSALMVLEPGQRGPLAAASLSSLDVRTSESPEALLLGPLERDGEPTAAAQRWTKIVVHDSHGIAGSLEDLDNAYRPHGFADAGYHLVINNGTGKPDGQVEASQRWRRAEAGAFVTGPDADWWNQAAIGVCLIGDAGEGFTPAQERELLWVLEQLQGRLGVEPADVHFSLSTSDAGPGLSAPFADPALQARWRNR